MPLAVNTKVDEVSPNGISQVEADLRHAEYKQRARSGLFMLSPVIDAVAIEKEKEVTSTTRWYSSEKIEVHRSGP